MAHKKLDGAPPPPPHQDGEADAEVQEAQE